MNDNLEDIIKKHKDLLDSYEPPEGHFARFKQKLDRQHQRTAHRLYRHFSIAASVVICLVGTFFLISHFGIDNTMTLSQVSPDYQEIEYYYKQLIDEKMQELKGNSESFYASYVEDHEAMEKVFKMLQKELYRNPNNKFIIESMVANYKTRLDILDKVNRQLEIINIAQK